MESMRRDEQPQQPPAEEPKEDLQAMTVRIPREWHEVLREQSFKQRRPMNDLIRDALREKFKLAATA
jgi:predicted HicB family RNase H-like nuclease